MFRCTAVLKVTPFCPCILLDLTHLSLCFLFLLVPQVRLLTPRGAIPAAGALGVVYPSALALLVGHEGVDAAKAYHLTRGRLLDTCLVGFPNEIASNALSTIAEVQLNLCPPA